MPASAKSSAICFRRSIRSGTSVLLPLRSVGPLPETSTTPGTFSSSLQIGSSKGADKRGAFAAGEAHGALLGALGAEARPRRLRLTRTGAASGARATQSPAAPGGAIIRGRGPSAAAACRSRYGRGNGTRSGRHWRRCWRPGDSRPAPARAGAPRCRRRARSRRWSRWARCALKSMLDTYSPLGITSTCTGACGLMSWKRERVVVLVDLLARQLAAQDAGEDVVAVVVGHGPGLAQGSPAA